jgi:hypothetical protein
MAGGQGGGLSSPNVLTNETFAAPDAAFIGINTPFALAKASFVTTNALLCRQKLLLLEHFGQYSQDFENLMAI